MAPHVDLLTLPRRLAHADPKTTEQFYHRTKRATEGRAVRLSTSFTGPKLTRK